MSKWAEAFNRLQNLDSQEKEAFDLWRASIHKNMDKQAVHARFRAWETVNATRVAQASRVMLEVALMDMKEED